MTADIERIHVYFTGRVQGVWFRASTKKRADQLGLNGWVRNLSDGRVEAVVEGPKDVIDELLRWCEHDMPLSRVDYVEVVSEEPRGVEGFDILR